MEPLGSSLTAAMMRNLVPKMTVTGSELNLSLRAELDRRLVKTENNKTCNMSLFFDIVLKSMLVRADLDPHSSVKVFILIVSPP